MPSGSSSGVRCRCRWREAERCNPAVKGEIAGDVRRHQAQSIGRELQHERQFIVAAGVPAKNGGEGVRFDRVLDAVGEAHFSVLPAHKEEGELSQEPVQAAAQK